MNTKSTWSLLLLAGALFAFIYFYERHTLDSGERALARPRLFPGLDAEEVTAVEVAGKNFILRAQRTNDSWRLTAPRYPAQSSPIEALVREIASATEHGRVTAQQILSDTGGLKPFGLQPPHTTVTLQQEGSRFQISFGARAPLVNQVYAQIAGTGEIVLVDASIAGLLPDSPDVWRDPALIKLAGVPYDRIQIREGARLLEIERDRTNQTWRLSKPLPARADANRIEQLIQSLETTRVAEFVTDLPSVDLERFGLLMPETQISFVQETNTLITLQFGSSPTNEADKVYVRRLSHTNIVTVPSELLEAIRQPYKAFHEPQLLSFSPAGIDRISVQAAESFILQRQSNGWFVVEPRPFPVDPALMALFITNLFRLEIVDFAREVPTELDLKSMGFNPPSALFGLYTTTTNGTGGLTNSLITQVEFGSNKVDAIHVRRTDETPVYLTSTADALNLPFHAFQLRDRNVWSFSGSNVVSISRVLEGKTNVFMKTEGKWATDPIIHEAIDEALFRLGQLQAVNWAGMGEQRFASFGIAPEKNMLMIEVARADLSGTNSHSISFGRVTFRGNIYAATSLPDQPQPVIMEFPARLYQELQREFGGPPIQQGK
ncbi:MAG: DUF4340 domain-containing protein [Verrucomicrobiota bacterium]|nr:DUF4340 domain-containing protein [Verrucomicrobiota bacterium]